MKKLLLFLFLFSTVTLSFAQRSDLAVNAPPKTSLVKTSIVTDTSNAVRYTVTSTDQKMKGDFKDLNINLSPNPVAGMLSLEIKSDRKCNLLVELKNSDDDVLFFKPVDLKRGDNIIPFETDDGSLDSFQLKLSEVNSNSSVSYTLLKK